MFNKITPPPYYMVAFISNLSPFAKRAPNISSGPTESESSYDETAQLMVDLAKQQPGFIGMDSARAADGFGITLSYWQDENAIKRWRQQTDHRLIQQQGKKFWYKNYRVRIAKVSNDYQHETE